MMYSSFQASQPATPEQRSTNNVSRVAKHPGGTAHACQECRRRKSRCNGARPCDRCISQAKEHLCVYVAQKPRIVPSQRAVDDLSTSLQQCREVLDRMFPSEDLTTLHFLSREELMDLAVNASSTSPPSLAPTWTTRSASIAGQQEVPAQSNASLVLDQLYAQSSEYGQDSPDGITDDVNALSLTSTKHSSYVGSSAIATALKVIAILCPGIMHHPSLTRPGSPLSEPERSMDEQASKYMPKAMEITYIDAYFDHLHVSIPMINEQQFRMNYHGGTKDDPAWLALQNMVLAMGSIAKDTSHETNHIVFYERAKEVLNFDSFGSGKIEIVQALALMGGFYLHYCNRPNVAVVVTGIALRMAYALGLHRKPPQAIEHSQDPLSDQETKRRTWWTLVCLDTWGSTTLGRPSTGDCFGPAISTPQPSFEDFADLPIESKAPALVAAVQFCGLSAQIQDRMASSACLDLAEAAAYDAQLERQYSILPPILKSPNRCPSNLLIPRAILKWRNQNARLLLHRPTLLAAALSGRGFEELAVEEQESILRCRKMAEETIFDITCALMPDPICGWHAVWHLFQASMVPLVSSFYEYNNTAERGKWHQQIEMVLRSLREMELWSPVAKRTYEVITELYQSAIQMPKDILAGSPQMLDEQMSFMLDDTWTNSMWFNNMEWQTFPLTPMAIPEEIGLQGFANGIPVHVGRPNSVLQGVAPTSGSMSRYNVI